MADHGNTELHLAALFGNTDAVVGLLSRGASTIAPNNFGKLPEELAKTPQLRVLLLKHRKAEVQRLAARATSLAADRDALAAERARLEVVAQKQASRITHLLRALERLEPISDIDFRSTKTIPKPVAAAATAATAAATASDGGGGGGGGGGGKKDAGGKPPPQQQGQKKAKKAKEPKKPKAGAAPAAAAAGGVPPIAELDIRVGEIVKVWEHPDSDKLWCESIECGEPAPRQVLSGLRHNFTAEQMTRRVLVVCNLKPAKLGGIPSHGMVLCASSDDHSQVEFLTPPEGAPVGERVTFESVANATPAGASRVAKKKLFKLAAPKLATTGDCVAAWDGHTMLTSAGPVKVASLSGLPIK